MRSMSWRWTLALSGLVGATLPPLVHGCSRSELRAPPAGESGATGGAGGGQPTPSFCGNGVVEPGEACDDGNAVPFDGCTPECVVTGCGDGFLGVGEECDLGPDNGDAPPFVLEQGSLSTPVLPVLSTVDSVTYYDYFSVSGHPGIEALFASRLHLLHSAQTQSLSLVMIHGIDFDTSGQSQPTSAVTFLIDVPFGSFVALSDDVGQMELFMDTNTSALGLWEFGNNTDGGVIETLPFPGSWALTIHPDFIAGIDDWAYVEREGELIDLSLTDPVTLRSFDQPSGCRLDCTIPICGDGIIDAGEVCDGPSGGIDCAPDCLSLLSFFP
jgi:cysteine-rich repeat protein